MCGSLVVDFEISYTTSGWYHGGINMRGSGVGHPKNPIGGLKGGSLIRFPPSELPPSESLGYLLASGWWSKHLGTYTTTKCGCSSLVLVH